MPKKEHRTIDGKWSGNFTAALIRKAVNHVESLQKQLFKAISEGKLMEAGMTGKNTTSLKLTPLITTMGHHT